MKAIKLLIPIALLLIAWACSQMDDYVVAVEEPFVRFSLVVDANGIPFEYPVKPQQRNELESFNYNGASTLKIPVLLSSPTLQEDVYVSYTYEFIGTPPPIGAVTIETIHSDLRFTGNQLSDTIYIHIHQRLIDTHQLKLKLTSASRDDIRLGYKRNVKKLDEITINLLPPETLRMRFSSTGVTLANGNIGASVEFSVLFPKGYFLSEINPLTLFSRTNQFDYNLEVLTTAPKAIRYRITLTENLSSSLSYNEIFILNNIPNYTQQAPTIFTISKDIEIARSGLVSSNFFNTSDPFYRLYGFRWRANTSNVCGWQSFNAFAVPVSVPVGSFNDANSDGYHDFKIGFVSPNAPIGTNPFDLQRIFEGESNSSPALNLVQALEFFPTGGNSTTGGVVQVIPQILQFIRLADGAIINIPISGSGTYQVVNTSTNLWRLDFEVQLDMTSIGQPSNVTYRYVMFNQSGQPTPPALSIPCVGSFNL